MGIRIYRSKSCECGEEFKTNGNTDKCPKCRIVAMKIRNRDWKRRNQVNLKSSSQGKNGGERFGDTQIVKRKLTHANGQDAWDVALPDHTQQIKREQCVKALDIQRMTPDQIVRAFQRGLF